MAKIAIFIDSDIVVRHFVLNRALQALEKEHDVLYVFPKNHRRVQFDLEKLNLKRYATVSVSTDRAYLYRRLFHCSVLRRMRQTSDRKMASVLWRDSLGLKPYLESWFFSWPFLHGWYKKRMLQKIGENTDLTELLRREKPDVIVHPTVLEGLFVSDLTKWGKEHNVPTIFLMNSWDNPAMKAMMVGFPDHLVVWGEISKRHAIEYLGMPGDQVLCLGGAQFDHYRLPPKESPEAYRRRLGLPNDKKILLYAGSSKGLNETSHLALLEEAIASGSLPNTTVLYRPHPWRAFPENEKDFFEMSFKHILMDPDMADCYKNYRGSNRLFIELADYEHTHTVLSTVDAVISPLSTILLEAVMHGKPIGAYLPDEDMKKNVWLYTMSNMVQFDDFFRLVDCLKIESAGDLVQSSKTLLEKASQPATADKLKLQTKPFVYFGADSYGDRINNLVNKVVPAKIRERAVAAR